MERHRKEGIQERRDTTKKRVHDNRDVKQERGWTGGTEYRKGGIQEMSDPKFGSEMTCKRHVFFSVPLPPRCAPPFWNCNKV